MASGLDLVTKDSHGGEGLFAPPDYTITPFAVEVAVAVAVADDERVKKKDEWSEMESADRCRYTSHCECWFVSKASNSKVKRSELDPLGNRREHPGVLVFAPYSTAPKPEVTLLGDFLPDSAIPPVAPFWYVSLVIPDDTADVPTPPSPPTSTISLSLFSLTRHLNRTAEVEEDFGLSYYLPFPPPPSKLIPSIKHPLPPQAYHAEIIGSCNGLYCLRSPPFRNKVSVIVWNPSIPESRKLPPFRNSEDWSRLTFGFGYDKSSSDYKVVKIFADDTLEVEVFSLYSKSNSWRSVQGFSFSQPRCDIQSVFCNGAVSHAGCLNWVVSVSDDGRSQTVIVSFNLATEKLQILPLPPTYGAHSHSLRGSSLWTLDGCLAFATIGSIIFDDRSFSRHASRVFDIWKMREYGIESSWSNISSIVFPHAVSPPFRILYLSKDILILHLYSQRLFVFDLKENTLVCPHIQHYCDIDYGSLGGVEPYVYSQVSPHKSLQGLDLAGSQSPNSTKDDTYDGSDIPCEAWWKRRVASLYAHTKEANSFWSICVAAAVMGLVIIGQQWQQERWRVLCLKWQIGVGDTKLGRMLSPLTRLKDALVGGHRSGSSIGTSGSGDR